MDRLRLLARREPARPRAHLPDPPTTRDSKAKLTSIEHRLDVNTLENLPADKLAMNDIAVVNFKLAQPLFVDPYKDNRATGAFIVIDESNNNTVGAGMIL